MTQVINISGLNTVLHLACQIKTPTTKKNIFNSELKNPFLDINLEEEENEVIVNPFFNFNQNEKNNDNKKIMYDLIIPLDTLLEDEEEDGDYIFEEEDQYYEEYLDDQYYENQ